MKRAWLVLAAALGACGGGGGGSHDDGAAGAGATGKAGADGGAAGTGAAGAAGSHSDAAPDGDAPGAAGADAASVEASDGGDASSDAADAMLPPWRSGSRLRARLLKPTDAADAMFRAVFDKDLAVECTFVQASDGATRCLPAAAVSYYDDDKCTSRVLASGAGCAPPAYVSRVDACRASGFKVGAKAVPAKLYAVNPAGTCVDVGDPGGQDFHALSAVPATGFVAATVLRDPRGGGLDMRYWQSDDGGLFPIGPWDVGRAAACVEGADDYDQRCVPEGVAPISASVPAFADDMCKRPAGYAAATCGAPPVTAVTVPVKGVCGPAVTYAEATKLTTTPYRSQAATCFPWASPPAGYAFYTPGDTISPDLLPVFTPLLQGAGRIKVHRFETMTGQEIDSRPFFYDGIKSVACLPEPTTKGLRCMSTRAYGVTFYADDKCASPVHAQAKIATPDPFCPVLLPHVLYVDKGATCDGPSTLELFEVGAAVAPAKLYRADSDKGCVADDADPAMLDVFGTVPASGDTAPGLDVVTE